VTAEEARTQAKALLARGSRCGAGLLAI